MTPKYSIFTTQYNLHHAMNQNPYKVRYAYNDEELCSIVAETYKKGYDVTRIDTWATGQKVYAL